MRPADKPPLRLSEKGWNFNRHRGDAAA